MPERMRVTGCNGVVAFSGVMGPVGRDAADSLIGWDLVKQLRQHGRITNVAGGDLDGPDLQRLLVDPNMYLAPDAAFGAAVFAGVPLAFALGLDASAVDQQVQWAFPSTVWDGHVRPPLAVTQGAEVRDRPLKPDQAQEALHEPRRLPQRHSEQHFHRKAGLDRFITEVLLPTALATRGRPPGHLRIEPDRQRSASLQRLIVSRPVRGLVFPRGPTAHASPLSHWIHAVNPSPDLCNNAGSP